ncbi:MAG: arsenate reductase (glutaredoxin) [Burkholderiaceae bacterium]|nr:arsenate reductase (glutaredoxin) [Burkholderiaceae bacterium]
MTTTTIYHNARCGTSRNTLALIRNAGIQPLVVDYLQSPPSVQQLAEIIQNAGLNVRQALREKEAAYLELGLDNPALTDQDLLQVMHSHPVLINRPFVVSDGGTRLCRPCELVLDILTQPQQAAFTKENGQPLIDESGQRIS